MIPFPRDHKSCNKTLPSEIGVDPTPQQNLACYRYQVVKKNNVTELKFEVGVLTLKKCNSKQKREQARLAVCFYFKNLVAMCSAHFTVTQKWSTLYFKLEIDQWSDIEFLTPSAFAKYSDRSLHCRIRPMQIKIVK